VVVSVFFALSLLLIALISTPDSSVVLYALAIFANGFSSAAYLNYTVSHLLHITPASTHYIVTGLLATFRSLSGSFGSAIGGGIFSRVLKARLEAGFLDDGGYYDHNDQRQELIRKLLGSPALVWQLEGHQRETAIAAYQDALRTMFLVAVALSVLMAFVQAGTGSSAPVEEEDSLTNETAEHED
jgi:MFS family permease